MVILYLVPFPPAVPTFWKTKSCLIIRVGTFYGVAPSVKLYRFSVWSVVLSVVCGVRFSSAVEH